MKKYKYLCFTEKPYNTGNRVVQLSVTGKRKKQIDEMIQELRKDFPESNYACTIETYTNERGEFRIKGGTK